MKQAAPRYHWYSEEVQGCRSRRAPTMRLSSQRNTSKIVTSEWKRAPEEQSRGNREQIIAVEVMSTIDEGRPGEHQHAALRVRRERLPAGALQRGLACDLEVRRSHAPIPSSSRRGRCCSTQASLVTAVRIRHMKPQARVSRVKLPCLSEVWLVTGETRSIFARSLSEESENDTGGTVPLASSSVRRQGDLGDEVDGIKGDTIKLRSDDDGSRKRGVPCGHLARQSFFKLSLLESL